jgi:hypothetical protein
MVGAAVFYNGLVSWDYFRPVIGFSHGLPIPDKLPQMIIGQDVEQIFGGHCQRPV